MSKQVNKEKLASLPEPVMPDIDDIMKFEQGEMEDDEIIDFFQGMINSGVVWTLQGFYGRTAAQLIEGGHCSPVIKRQAE